MEINENWFFFLYQMIFNVKLKASNDWDAMKWVRSQKIFAHEKVQKSIIPVLGKHFLQIFIAFSKCSYTYVVVAVQSQTKHNYQNVENQSADRIMAFSGDSID